MSHASKRLALVPVLVFSFACGSGSQSASERDQRAEDYAKSLGADVQVKTNDDGTRSVAVDRSVGGLQAQAGSNLAVPAGFPDDVPVYPKLNVASASQMPGLGFMLQGHSGDSIDAVASFYEAEMKTRGWTAGGGQQNPAMRLLQFKKDARTVSVTLFPGNPGTTVQLATMAVG